MIRVQPEGLLPSRGRACDTRSQMDLTLTLAACTGLLALAVFAGWRGARPPNLHRGPRLVPWRFIMVTTAALLLVMLAHLVNLMGFTTGR